MICGIDEFLLVLQKWMTESATVVMLLLVFREDPEKPSIGGRLSGRILSIDPDMPGFAFSANGTDPIVVDLDGWTIGFGADFISAKEPFSVGFTLHPPGIGMSLFNPA